MEWLEIIELRAAAIDRGVIESQLLKLMSDAKREAKEMAIKTFTRAKLSTDFSIHLLHDTQNVENAGSSLGLHLVSMLRAYGLVNHSVWVEMAPD